MLGMSLMQAVRLECQDVHPRYNVPEESLASPVLCDDHAAHVARSAVRVRIQGISDFLQGSRRLHDDKLGGCKRKAWRVKDVWFLQHDTRQRCHRENCQNFFLTLASSREWLYHWKLIDAIRFHDIDCDRAGRVCLHGDGSPQIWKLHDGLSHPLVRILLAIALRHGRFHLVVYNRSRLDVCQRLLHVCNKVRGVLNSAGISDQAVGDTQTLSNFQGLIIIAHNSHLFDKSLDTTQRRPNVWNFECIDEPCSSIERVLRPRIPVATDFKRQNSTKSLREHRLARRNCMVPMMWKDWIMHLLNAWVSVKKPGKGFRCSVLLFNSQRQGLQATKNHVSSMRIAHTSQDTMQLPDFVNVLLLSRQNSTHNIIVTREVLGPAVQYKIRSQVNRPVVYRSGKRCIDATNAVVSLTQSGNPLRVDHSAQGIRDLL
mmetsp:Transcript_9981/g.22770  ORF Transcript_9981/g.22770 Transcript_9981/m.22770 type:complete len:429 (-) Transcript_9981:685-1971(-)